MKVQSKKKHLKDSDFNFTTNKNNNTTEIDNIYQQDNRKRKIWLRHTYTERERKVDRKLESNRRTNETISPRMRQSAQEKHQNTFDWICIISFIFLFAQIVCFLCVFSLRRLFHFYNWYFLCFTSHFSVVSSACYFFLFLVVLSF